MSPMWILISLMAELGLSMLNNPPGQRRSVSARLVGGCEMLVMDCVWLEVVVVAGISSSACLASMAALKESKSRLLFPRFPPWSV